MRTATAILLVCSTVVFAITEAPIFFSEMQRADADRPRVGPAPPGTTEYDVGDSRRWAFEQLGQEAQDDLGLLVPQIESIGPAAFKAFARLTGEQIPGWI